MVDWGRNEVVVHDFSVPSAPTDVYETLVAYNAEEGGAAEPWHEETRNDFLVELSCVKAPELFKLYVSHKF